MSKSEPASPCPHRAADCVSCALHRVETLLGERIGELAVVSGSNPLVWRARTIDQRFADGATPTAALDALAGLLR